MLEHVKCETPDLAKANLEKLKALFPGVVTEGPDGVSIDVEALKQECSATPIEGNVERYAFTWPGKRAAKAAASASTTKTLRPCREESVNFDTTENLYIEGDNLEVLKLLQTSYAGKIKMIYIDPPYNTGHDFVYRDRFSLTDKELATRGDQCNDDEKWNVDHPEPNDAAAARYHSNWCSMMYPRLKLARQLLRDDGIIFISIANHEISNLKKLLDEIFGEMNYLGIIDWESKTKCQNTKTAKRQLQNKQEYILVYKRDGGRYEFNLRTIAIKKYPEYDNNGYYRLEQVGEMSSKGGRGRETMVFPIMGVMPKEGNQWKIGAETKKEFEKRNDIVVKDGVVYFKIREDDEDDTKEPFWSFIPKTIGTGETGKGELDDLIPENGFETVKPVGLMKKLVFHIPMDSGSIILDFFSGSATTAHAVMQLNAEDGGSRKFIMVQLPESCAEDSEAAKAGYKNICEIGKERIRRAGKKICEELRVKSEELKKKAEQNGLGLFDERSDNRSIEKSEQSNNPKIPDIGFRVLKLDSSSLNDTSATVSETTQEFVNFDRIKSDRSSEDLLFQVLLETHIPLSDKIVRCEVGGNEVLFVGVADAQESAPPTEAPLLACLDAKAKMTTDFFIEIAKLKPGIAFFRDDAFADDSARTNLQQSFEQFSPSSAIKVI